MAFVSLSLLSSQPPSGTLTRSHDALHLLSRRSRLLPAIAKTCAQGGKSYATLLYHPLKPKASGVCETVKAATWLFQPIALMRLHTIEMWLFQPVAQTLAIEYTKLSSPLSPLSCHPYHPIAKTWLCQPVVSMRRMHTNTCGLAVSACCLQLSNTWLCQPVAQTYMAVSAGRIDVTCSGANTCGLAVSACGTMHLMFFYHTCQTVIQKQHTPI